MHNRLKTEQSSQQISRSLWVVGVISFLLILRLFILQVVDRHHYQTQSLHNRLELVPLPPQRGIIYDRNGVVLAKNIPGYQLEVIPFQAKQIDTVLNTIAHLIPLSDEERNHFSRRKQQYSRFEAVPIKAKLTESEAGIIYTHLAELPGVRVKPILIRYYPQGASHASVLGYVSQITDQESAQLDPKNYKGTLFYGKAGFEKFAEPILHGTTGYIAMETNASGRNVRTITHNKATSGHAVTLTIDSRLQQIAHQALGHEQGAIVALDPNNGHVLTLVSTPSYDPNGFAHGDDAQIYHQLHHQPGNPLYNRAVRGQYAQGSTIKPFIALSGLENGVITRQTTIEDPGHFSLPNSPHVFHDWLPHGHGQVDAAKALVVSCDTFFYRLALKLGMNTMKQTLNQFGFGTPTGIEIPNESTGVVPSRDWKYAMIGEPWYVGDTIVAGIGQGYMLSTPLQLAQAVAIFANKGKGFRATLIDHTTDATGASHPNPPKPLPPILLHKHWIWSYLSRAMHQVVMSKAPLGTGFRFGQDAQYSVAAKTGTAQVYRPKNGQFVPQPELPKKLRDNALFVAFAPIKHPKIAIAVVIEHVSSATAARVARKVVDAYLLPTHQEVA